MGGENKIKTNETMKIVIIEDEIPNSEELQFLLKELNSGYDVSTVLRTVAEVKQYFSSGGWADLVFSDIRLTDGIVFDAFNEDSLALRIVFLTAYDSYIMQALECNCVQYLLKPIELDTLRKVMEKVAATEPQRLIDIKQSFNKVTEYRRKLMLPVSTGLKFVSVDDIVIIRLDDGKVKVYCNNGDEIVVESTIDNFEKSINSVSFFRANRQTIINTDYLDSVEINFMRKYYAKMNGYNNISIPISKEKMIELRRLLSGV